MSQSPQGRGWIILGIILVLVSIGTIAMGVAWSFSRFDLEQFVMPGTHDFQMADSGVIYIAYEPVSSIDGEFLASPEFPTMELQLISAEDGHEASIEKPLVKASYSMGTRRGFYIGSAQLDQGSWRLVGHPGQDTKGREVFALGRSSVNSIVMPIIAAGIAAALMGPLGLGCLVIGITKRLKSGSRLGETGKRNAPTGVG